MDENFNRLVDNLPENLIRIDFDHEFNKPVNNLPNKLKELNFVSTGVFNQPIDNLPDSVEILTLPRNYNQTINKLPNNLKVLNIFNSSKSVQNDISSIPNLDELKQNYPNVNFKFGRSGYYNDWIDIKNLD